jgi:hypothetical protein
MSILRSSLILVILGTVPASASTVQAQPLAANYGIGTFLHPIEQPQTISYPRWCQDRPFVCRKDHVYIFGVNGLNVLCSGNFNGLLSYLRNEGFTNTHFAQLYTVGWIPDEIRKIRQSDSQARIALIGFSWGANSVRRIANDLNRDGTQVDLLVYLVGDLVRDEPESKPCNVRRILNIRAHGLVLLGGDLFFNGEDMQGARNVTLQCRHILAPSRHETIEAIMEELLELACVPVGATAPAPALAPVPAPVDVIPDSSP